MGTLREIVGVFLKLGTISFGGPAAHIANMEHEVIERRGWISREYFLDLFGATHLIPGPNAVEMASHIGYSRAGLIGSLTAGLSFTLPAVLISVALAVGYHRYGSLPAVGPFLSGIKPVVLAIIFTALWRLGRKALTNWPAAAIALGAAVAVLRDCDEVLVLLAATVIGVFLLSLSRRGNGPTVKGTAGAVAAAVTAGSCHAGHAAPLAVAGTTASCATVGTASFAAGGTVVPVAFSLWKLGLFFLKVGAVLYGGGYVLIAYLEGGWLVGEGWLTRRELFDAVAIGQITPGPMLSTASFVGYLVTERAGGNGLVGAAVATLAFLLPSFLLVALLNPLIPRLRKSRWASRFLDAVTAASIGLRVAVTVTLTGAMLKDTPAMPEQIAAVLIALVAAVLSLRFKVASAWLVLGGALAGRLIF